MSLDSLIKPELWDSISKPYESGHYTEAIRNAIATLTNTLRDKSGLDGDGERLVGATLGFSPGNPPKIKITKLQTETERDIQQGYLETLKGIYKLIRNPRSHEIIEDTKKNADAIIIFIDFLLDFLGKSYQSFTLEGFANTVLEEHFVLDDEYIEGIIEQIPIKKRIDVIIHLFRNRTWDKLENISSIINNLLTKLSENEIDDFSMLLAKNLKQQEIKIKFVL